MYGKKRDEQENWKDQKNQEKMQLLMYRISVAICHPNGKETRKYVSTPPKPRQWDAFISSSAWLFSAPGTVAAAQEAAVHTVPERESGLGLVLRRRGPIHPSEADGAQD